MKYVRNSRNQENTKELTKQERLIQLQQTDVAANIVEQSDWLTGLDSLEKFSSEWVHTVAVELLMQCMGKKEIVTGYKGQETILRIFKEKQALKTLEMIAKMNGHLFDVVKGTISKTISGTVEHDHKVELIPNANRTAQVFNILAECGAIQPEIKQLDPASVDIIHSA